MLASEVVSPSREEFLSEDKLPFSFACRRSEILLKRKKYFSCFFFASKDTFVRKAENFKITQEVNSFRVTQLPAEVRRLCH